MTRCLGEQGMMTMTQQSFSEISQQTLRMGRLMTMKMMIMTMMRRQHVPTEKSAMDRCHLVRGKMDHEMEDHVVAENRKVDGYELGLYAIFDGHSGRNVDKYLQAHLFDNNLNEPDFWRNPKSAIRGAYKTTDQKILEHVVVDQPQSQPY